MTNTRLVYTSDGGPQRYCARCGNPKEECTCRRGGARAGIERPGLPRDGIVRLLRDRKHRGGKTVTIIVGLPNEPELLADLAKSLKRACGIGGSIKGDTIELQGDVVTTVQARLTALGYQVKVAGG
jgi:translation initiation factor 1